MLDVKGRRQNPGQVTFAERLLKHRRAAVDLPEAGVAVAGGEGEDHALRPQYIRQREYRLAPEVHIQHRAVDIRRSHQLNRLVQP